MDVTTWTEVHNDDFPTRLGRWWAWDGFVL
jgi:hypothetical protein